MKVFIVLTVILISLIPLSMLPGNLMPLSVSFKPHKNSSTSLAKPAQARFDSIIVRERNNVAGVALLTAKKIITENGKIVGNAFTVCTKVASGGSFGSGVQQCHGTFNLPKGKIAVAGSRHSIQRYTLIVIGGTGFYNNTGGTLDAFQTGSNPTTEKLVFKLIP